jgi:hypothetical protein
MQHGGSPAKKRGGLFALLAFLLSVLPVATQATMAAAPDERLVVQLANSFAFEAAAAATVPQATQASRSEIDAPTGDGSAGSIPLRWVLFARRGAAIDHARPPSTAPPGSASTDAYRARAPPVR